MIMPLLLCTPSVVAERTAQASDTCAPQVGEVLVERTVAEVAPAVRSNRDQLDLVRPAEAVHAWQVSHSQT